MDNSIHSVVACANYYGLFSLDEIEAESQARGSDITAQALCTALVNYRYTTAVSSCLREFGTVQHDMYLVCVRYTEYTWFGACTFVPGIWRGIWYIRTRDAFPSTAIRLSPSKTGFIVSAHRLTNIILLTLVQATL